MKKYTSAFTFVELIVVITILAILATIGFSVYQSYLESSRDTNRVVQLSEISEGFKKLSLSARLPFPESMIEIQAGSGIVKTFAYQGFAGEKVMQAIGYMGGGQDPENSLYPTYMLSESRKDFQLMSFIKDANLLSSKEVYATTDFEKLFPKVVGSPLGILLEQGTQIPLHMLPAIQTAKVYNITTGTGNLIVYFEDKKILSSAQGLQKMLPNSSCERILELGRSNGNGIYTLNPDGGLPFSVYCDMLTDGGGWMMVARSVLNTTYTGNFGWLYSAGNVNDDTIPYSLGPNVLRVLFSELMFGEYSEGKKIRPYNHSVDSVMYGAFFAHTGTLYTAGKYAPFERDLLLSGTSATILVPDMIGGNWNNTQFMYSQPFLCPINNCAGASIGDFQATSYYRFTPGYGGQGLHRDSYKNYSQLRGKPGIFFIR